MRVAFVVAVILLSSGSAVAEVKVKADRFTKTTTISTVPQAQSSDGQPALTVMATLTEGKTTAGLLLVSSSSKGWRYLNCNSTAWLVDDEPFPMPSGKHDGSVGRGYVLEFLNISPITGMQVAQLGSAKRIEYKVCNDEYLVTPSEMQDLARFHELLLEHKAW